MKTVMMMVLGPEEKVVAASDEKPWIFEVLRDGERVVPGRVYNSQ